MTTESPHIKFHTVGSDAFAVSRIDQVGGIRSATWIVEAPWAHPAWDEYLILLIDLTGTAEGVSDPHIMLYGATHEVQVWALAPSKTYIRKIHLDPMEWRFIRLEPMNHAYQFIADSYEDAWKRVNDLVGDIGLRRLSPDTDAIRDWNLRFRDGARVVASRNPRTD